MGSLERLNSASETTQQPPGVRCRGRGTELSQSVSIDLLSNLHIEFNMQVCECSINKTASSFSAKGPSSGELP